MAYDCASKKRWEDENVIKLTIKINRNTDIHLYEIFKSVQGSKGALAKNLLRAGLKYEEMS